MKVDVQDPKTVLGEYFQKTKEPYDISHGKCQTQPETYITE